MNTASLFIQSVFSSINSRVTLLSMSVVIAELIAQKIGDKQP